ncbi:MAG: prepilin-type N-terminal cleavage/methylation domain-containing protein [Planctomycetota bacterium]
MSRRRRNRQAERRLSAFTLVEMVMVVTIIGIIAAIAVPRISTVGTRASATALEATLANVRKAIDCYFAEHGKFPGYDPSTSVADGKYFVQQLTMYTDAAGKPNATAGSNFPFGPYLRAPFPHNPMNRLDTVHVRATRADPNPAGGSVGWVAVLSTGDFGVSATDPDLEKIGIVTPEGKSRVLATQ